VHVISRKRLREFWERRDCGDAQQPLRAWFAEARAANWKTPAELKAAFGTASILKGGRAVFNVAGNKYRLVVVINYPSQVMYVRFVGTHEEYDQINANTI
jgi:mRNA interferase HigB